MRTEPEVLSRLNELRKMERSAQNNAAIRELEWVLGWRLAIHTHSVDTHKEDANER